MNSNLDDFNNNLDQITSFDLKPVKNIASQKIISVDVCIYKSLFAVCDQNKCVQIWDFKTGDLELEEFFDENANSLTIHPTGFYLTLSFSNRIDYFTILYDKLICTKSFKYNSKDYYFIFRVFVFFLLSLRNFFNLRCLQPV